MTFGLIYLNSIDPLSSALLIFSILFLCIACVEHGDHVLMRHQHECLDVSQFRENFDVMSYSRVENLTPIIKNLLFLQSQHANPVFPALLDSFYLDVFFHQIFRVHIIKNCFFVDKLEEEVCTPCFYIDARPRWIKNFAHIDEIGIDLNCPALSQNKTNLIPLYAAFLQHG